MAGAERRRRRTRPVGDGLPRAPRPSPQDLAMRNSQGALAPSGRDLDAGDSGPERSEASGATDRPDPNDRDREDSGGDRGLRGLVGGGSSQVGIVAALRARDASRPTEADLAAAEANLVIVRRGWVPREGLPIPVRRQ